MSKKSNKQDSNSSLSNIPHASSSMNNMFTGYMPQMPPFPLDPRLLHGQNMARNQFPGKTLYSNSNSKINLPTKNPKLAGVGPMFGTYADPYAMWNFMNASEKTPGNNPNKAQASETSLTNTKTPTKEATNAAPAAKTSTMLKTPPKQKQPTNTPPKPKTPVNTPPKEKHPINTPTKSKTPVNPKTKAVKANDLIETLTEKPPRRSTRARSKFDMI